MRNLVVFLHTSLDGIVEGPNGAMDIGFVHYNEELEQFAQKVTANADTILWGRATYEMMYQYWPNMLNNEEASEHERTHAVWIDAVEKIVCSRTLQETTWNHTTLIHEQITEKIHGLKAENARDILVLGSPRLAKFLLKENLVDILKLTVSPVLVGNGLRFFEGIEEHLELVDTQIMESGVLGLTYRIRKDRELSNEADSR